MFSLTKLKNDLKPFIVPAVIYVGLPLFLIVGVPKACNMAWNNRSIETPAYKHVSRATGIYSHTQFTKYTDGSYDVKKYPVLGHRTFSSELYQDLNGDGLVDRIRKNGPEWKMNRLVELLVREHDYDSNKERFEKADQQLQELIQKYSNN